MSAYHKQVWRNKAASNHKLAFLNVQFSGLNGLYHNVLHNIVTTQDVDIARIQVKMLSGDYQCYYSLSRERGSNPQCPLCPSTPSAPAPNETITHILTQCAGTREVRERVWVDLINTVAYSFPNNNLANGDTSDDTKAQFILDCTSLNLEASYRINPCHPAAAIIFRQTRQYCFAVHKGRIGKLKTFGHIK